MVTTGQPKPLQSMGFGRKSLERATRIELAFSAWEADVLPLNYARNGSIVSSSRNNAPRIRRVADYVPYRKWYFLPPGARFAPNPLWNYSIVG